MKWICVLYLSNLLENALEASRKTTMSRQQILLEIRQHSASLLLIRVENNFDGIIKEKSHLLHSTKRKGLGIGTSLSPQNGRKERWFL